MKNSTKFVPYRNQELHRGDQVKMWFNPTHQKLVADVLYKVRDGVWAVWIEAIGGEYQVDKTLIHGISRTLHERYQYSRETLEGLNRVYMY